MLECTLDGEPCTYTQLLVRTQSPAFAVEVLEGSLLTDFGLEPGDYFPSVSGGWWMLLPPPSPGGHDLRLKARNGSSQLDVTYHLWVD